MQAMRGPGAPRLPDVCMLTMQFLTKSLDLEVDKGSTSGPGFHLAFEAYIGTLEIATILAILGLTGTAFLPQVYVDIQVRILP